MLSDERGIGARDRVNDRARLARPRIQGSPGHGLDDLLAPGPRFHARGIRPRNDSARDAATPVGYRLATHARDRITAWGAVVIVQLRGQRHVARALCSRLVVDQCLIFMVASTNLVIELAVVLLVLLGWPFVIAQIVGGAVMVVLLVALVLPRVSPRSRGALKRTDREGGVERRDRHPRQIFAIASVSHRATPWAI